MQHISNQRVLRLMSLFLCLLFGLNISCKKFVEIAPPRGQLIRTTIFLNESTATAAMLAVYDRFNSATHFLGGELRSLNSLFGLSSDELIYYGTSQDYQLINLNNILPTNAAILDLWTQAYSSIYSVNAIIEGVTESSSLSSNFKSKLIGEAKFVRALLHFYLVNIFGDVPYISSSDYNLNSIVSRTPTEQVYQAVISDLLDAKSLLPENYPSSERIRPNKWAATALLSRVYLYKADWINAESQATEVISQTSFYNLGTLNQVFKKTSTDAILQIKPNSVTSFNASQGSIFIFSGIPTGTSLSLRGTFINGFESGDQRQLSWVGSTVGGSVTYYYPFKYKRISSDPVQEYYSTFLSLGEQHLIRAEARARQNKLIGSNSATMDINIIRVRAGLGSTTANTQSQIMNAIEQERKIELFSEWGHRWFDLKRYGKLDEVLAPLKTGWQSTDALFPLPQAELLLNQNLSQNPGY